MHIIIMQYVGAYRKFKLERHHVIRGLLVIPLIMWIVLYASAPAIPTVCISLYFPHTIAI